MRPRQFQAPRFLISIMLAAGTAWGFIALAGGVHEGETRAIDERVILAFRNADISDPVGPRWLEEAVRDVTALGSNTVLLAAVLTVVGFLALQRDWRAAVFTLAATGGGLLAAFLLKEFFDRPRPDLIPHEVEVFTKSFPSGHAMISAVVYLTLASLVTRLMERRRLKIYAMTIAIVFTAAIGVSRVYLGVHWPSDVLAGWMAGASWALVCWSIASRIGLGRDGGANNGGGRPCQ
jgi:undecaprenyl-diphosphatase